MDNTNLRWDWSGVFPAVCMAIVMASCGGSVPKLLAQTNTKTAVIRPKVVVVVYFEVGKDKGDTPGELQYWVERDHLDRVIEVPGMSRTIRANADGSELAMAVGPGNIRPGVNLMAFGLDPRFDLRKSYWLINGIAGVSPREMAVGSAVWTDFVVNGNLVHEIDAREIPKDWPDGFYALDKSKPEEQPRVPVGSEEDVRTWQDYGAHSNRSGSVMRMNPGLMSWALGLTHEMKLPETDAMRALGALYKGYPAAQRPPQITVGANVATETYWHGAKMDEWAHRWVRYMTDGRASYGSTAENDSGAMVALAALTRAGRADWNRALLLRTGSNFDMQPPSETAEQSANRRQNAAYEPALESAYLVGSRIVKSLIDGWAQYEGNIPSEVEQKTR
ncbi:MAG: purine nucleoside permease [Candidatus Acidiferrales bacterium]|jgi:purine nucleoside permease